MTKQELGGYLVFSLLFFTAHGHAHHAVTAHFDRNKNIDIRGVVVDFKLRSPHSSFVIDGIAFINGVRQSDAVERWEVEASSLPGMRKMGIHQDTFQLDDDIQVIAWQNRQPDFRFVFGTTFIAADDKVFDEAIEPRSQDPVSRSRIDGSVGVQKIVGRWRSRGYLNGDESPLPLNEVGLTAWRSYDPKLSSATTCESQSIPGVFSAPYTFDVQINGQRVTLHNEAYSVVRTVQIGGQASLANPNGVYGKANAQVDAGTLVVESRDYPPSKWGLGIATHLNGGGADVPSSDQKTVVERYSVSEDGQTLILDYILTDPVYMTKPHNGRVEFARVADDTPIYPYDCDVESAAMFSRNRGDELLQIGKE